MKIEVKFGLGEKVWSAEFNDHYKCVEVVYGKITEICIAEDGNSYYIDDISDSIAEEYIIADKDTDKLVEKLKELSTRE